MKEKVIILGSGALTIGQAGEFDYSGSQAVYAFIEDGYEVTVINPNIATVQTNPIENLKVYLYPVNAEWVTKVIKKEKPKYIVAGFGGQTAINCLLELNEIGTLKDYQVEVLGSSIETIHATEDRSVFSEKMQEIQMPIAQSQAASTIEAALSIASEIGYPVIARCAYALGGLGSGFANNESELIEIMKKSLSYVPHALIEKSLQGWKEIEYEVMRDLNDNTICICNMENIDPLGIHTGDSIVVTPSLTISDHEYQLLRDASIKIARHLKIIGECNVQFALSPNSSEFYVIEVNPRLSRSSALASKASGYPIASIAARVIQGKFLTDLRNPVTEITSAFFEPSLDYIALKVPKWDLDKFQGVNDELSSMMKSIGEVMSIGRSFNEALQKSLRMVFSDSLGLFKFNYNNLTKAELWEKATVARPTRIFAVFALILKGLTPLEIAERTKISAWFLFELEKISSLTKFLISEKENILNKINNNIDTSFNFYDFLRSAKELGFSDDQLAYILSDEQKNKELSSKIREVRKALNIIPLIKRIDTSSGEFTTNTNYLYMTYHGSENDIKKLSDNDSYITLGAGAYRIGSSVEFDWACCEMSRELQKRNKMSIIINCNPETVSTDFKTSDRLYFEELTAERVSDIYEYEQPQGVIACLGGQEANNLINPLEQNKVKVLAHSFDILDRTESRVKFSQILEDSGISQPKWASAVNIQEALEFVEKVGFPVLIRPSFVLSGSGMKVVYNQTDLEACLGNSKIISEDYPLILTQFLYGAYEIDVDGVSHNGKLISSFISEHVEKAGIHSGDATIIYPARELAVSTQREIEAITKKLVEATGLNGPFNIQYLVKDHDIFVIECNARSSRTLPFISKVSNKNIISMTADVIFNSVKNEYSTNTKDLYGVKAAMFSFNRLDGIDPILGVEMLSTGEAGCIDTKIENAFLQAMISTGYTIPSKGVLLSTGDEADKFKLLPTIKTLTDLGLNLYATSGTYNFYKDRDIKISEVNFNDTGDCEIQSLMKNKLIDLVVNIPKNYSKEEIDVNVNIRKSTIKYGIPLLTDADKMLYFINSIVNYKENMNLKEEINHINGFHQAGELNE